MHIKPRFMNSKADDLDQRLLGALIALESRLESEVEMLQILDEEGIDSNAAFAWTGNNWQLENAA